MAPIRESISDNAAKIESDPETETGPVDLEHSEPSMIPGVAFVLFLTAYVTLFFVSRGATAYAVATGTTPLILLVSYGVALYRENRTGGDGPVPYAER